MMLLLVSAALVASASACCIPEQWEGKIGFNYAAWNSTSQNGTYVEGSIEISFDAKNSIIAENQYFMVNEKPMVQRLVMDYNQGVSFVIQQDGSCTKHMLGKFSGQCLPDNSTDKTLYNYGLGPNTVNTNGYRFMVGQATEVYMFVTSDTCVPVAEDIITKYKDVTAVSTMGYNNIKPGISNFNAFYVPVTCTKTLPLLPPLPGNIEVARRSLAFTH